MKRFLEGAMLILNHGVFPSALQGGGCAGRWWWWGVLICAGVWEMPCLGLSQSHVTPDWAFLGGLAQGPASCWEANDSSCSKSHFDSRTLTSTSFLINKQNPLTFNANLLRGKSNDSCSTTAIKMYRLSFSFHVSTPSNSSKLKREAG